MSYSRIAGVALCVALAACIHTNGPVTAPVSQGNATAGHATQVANTPSAGVDHTRPAIAGRTFLHPASASSEAKVTVTFEDADIRDVVAAFARFAGRTIVIRSRVQGWVSVEVHGEPWDVALQSILAQQQLTASVDQNGDITVGPVGS